MPEPTQKMPSADTLVERLQGLVTQQRHFVTLYLEPIAAHLSGRPVTATDIADSMIVYRENFVLQMGNREAFRSQIQNLEPKVVEALCDPELADAVRQQLANDRAMRAADFQQVAEPYASPFVPTSSASQGGREMFLG